MNYQAVIVRKSDGKRLWVNGGFASAAQAQNAAEIVLIGFNPDLFNIVVETLGA